MEVSGQLHTTATLSQGENPSTHWIGGWVGPGDHLSILERIKISCLCWHSNPGSSSPQSSHYDTHIYFYFWNLPMYRNVLNYSKVTCFCNILILTNVHFVTVSSPGNLSLESPLLTPAQSLTTVTSTAANLTLGKWSLLHFTTILMLLRHTQNL